MASVIPDFESMTYNECTRNLGQSTHWYTTSNGANVKQQVTVGVSHKHHLF